MRKSKTACGKISVRATLEQINELKEAATAEKKSISVYVRDKIFSQTSQTLDTARMDFYLNINENLKNIKDDLDILKKEHHLVLRYLQAMSQVQLNMISKETATKFLYPQKKI